MPELPEVEYIARQLRTALVGRDIVAAEVLWPRAIATPDSAEFAARIAGQRVTGIGRRAKYLLIELGDGDVLLVHRRMTGNLILAGALTEAAVDVPYTRVRFTLDDGQRLLFTDPRKFGRLALLPMADLPHFFRALGPEPLEDAFTAAALGARLAGRARAIKALLLDQAVLAGLGNIYADEALFRAGIHPLRPGTSLVPAEIAALHAAIRAVLMSGIEHGGTTIGRHRDIYDEAGANLEHLLVYQHTGQPCVRCGTSIQRIVVAQRGTHFCPHCQPATTPER
ncbi:MAG TPA: bifunctional DNA-formamidopyrimidine glycosylase/DNA-(apurinic or apyrimidinic site) lyase [Ktedonobacterales bacterium]|jgi:formamidopyrimidine-DNA glycosylase|nr:bifunctional DNA-formamidopyrimidine glycosylase/DNA-(apurinic or apyrimidinic site) lyase [Ktedonobacterales bacterium]